MIEGSGAFRTEPVAIFNASGGARTDASDSTAL